MLYQLVTKNWNLYIYLYLGLHTFPSYGSHTILWCKRFKKYTKLSKTPLSTLVYFGYLHTMITNYLIRGNRADINNVCRADGCWLGKFIRFTPKLCFAHLQLKIQNPTTIQDTYLEAKV